MKTSAWVKVSRITIVLIVISPRSDEPEQ